jgi:16S rRNA processing protein RimM
MSAGWRPERVRLGTVGRPHGLDGTVVVESPCGWFAFDRGVDVLVAGESRRIVRRAGTDVRPLIAFADISSREGAEAIRGAPLEIGRESVPEPDEGAWFHFDLVGCDVWQGDERLGAVAAVEEGVAHDLLLLDSGERLPFVEAVVPVVDVAARRIEVATDFVVR